MPSSTGSLSKQIGLWPAVSIIAGSIIGSGVFMKPSSMAAELGSPVWLTVVWIVAGIFTFFCALIFAELGAMMPVTGGLYAYFKKAFGDFFAYLYGWSAFSVINTASVAAIAFVCAEYANYFLQLPRFDAATEHSFKLAIPFVGDLYPLENFGVKLLAILILVLLGWLNYRSVKGGSYFQFWSTVIKIAVIAALVLGILFSGKGEVSNFWIGEFSKQGSGFLTGFIIAMTGAFFAYDGSSNITFIAGEIKQPQKNIPLSLFIGVGVCVLVYILINQAYLYVLPIEKVAGSKLVAADAINVAWGAEGSAIIAAMIVICTLGAINGNLMSTARVSYAMAKDHLFPSTIGKEHHKFNTPANAVILHCAWIALFILSGSFNMLADMFVFVTWIAYLFVAIGLFILRKRLPDLPRPYKTWGYPVTPLLFIAFSAFYLFITLQSDIRNYINGTQPVINSVLGLFIVAAGIPLYFYFKRKSKSSS